MVQLQRCGRPHRRHGSFDELVDGLCLSTPRGHEHDVAGLEDGSDALGEAVLRTSSTFPAKNRALSLRVWLVNVLIRPEASEEPGSLNAICPSVPIPRIRSTPPALSLVRRPHTRWPGPRQSVRPKYPSRIDIDLVDELSLDDVPVPLRMVCWQADVLIEHERSHLRKRQGTLRHSAAESS